MGKNCTDLQRQWPADAGRAGNNARPGQSKRLRGGDTVTFAYDALNRPTSETFPGGKSQKVYWGYDLLNRQLYAAYGSPSGTGGQLDL